MKKEYKWTKTDGPALKGDYIDRATVLSFFDREATGFHHSVYSIRLKRATDQLSMSLPKHITPIIIEKFRVSLTVSLCWDGHYQQ